MIKYTIDQKTLVVPSGLGNFGQGSGSGSGVTPEEAARIASAVTAEAIDEYDTELQVDLEDIRDAVSGNSQDIAILSGLSTDIAAISGQTTANTQNIGILSGNVETLSASTVALSQTVAGKQDTLTAGNGIDLSGSTISVKIGEGLGFSGDTLVVSGGTGGGPAVYYLDKMTQQERVALYNEIQSYTEQTFPAGDYRFFTYMVDNDEYQGNIELCVARFYDETPVSFSGIYQSRYSSQVLQRGYELASNGDFVLTFEAKVNINKPEPKRYVLNLMTQEERAALYTELSAYRYSYAAVSSSFPVWDYSFYYWVGDQESDPYNDKFSGFVPLDIALLHPGDYGGAVFFTGIVKTRNDGSTVIAVRYNMASDGSVEVFSDAISQ